jgi:hypothetical protein
MGRARVIQYLSNMMRRIRPPTELGKAEAFSEVPGRLHLLGNLLEWH